MTETETRQVMTMTKTMHTMTDEEAAAYFENEFEPTRMRDRSATAEIEEAVHARQRAQDGIDAAVIRARRDGVTWTEIALALGVSHQAAMKRYRDKVSA